MFRPSLRLITFQRPLGLSLLAYRRLSVLNPRRHKSTKALELSRAVSNTDLVNIEKYWGDMPPAEQAEIWMSLRYRMKANWKDLTAHEKKSSYWIAFGPHGPRAVSPPGESWKVFYYVMGCILISGVLFAIILGARSPPPKTMTKEWQEASNNYLREQGTEPLTGISSEGYRDRGMVQAPPSI